MNYETTWYPSNRAVYDLLRENRLGEIRKVVIHDGHQGPKEIGVQPEFLQWLTDPAENGAGALYDFGCYGADLMTWFMHGEAPLSVTAVAQTDKPQIYPRVDDDATIILRYPRAQAVLMPSWNWPFGRKDTEVYGATGYAIAVNPTQVRERSANPHPKSPSRRHRFLRPKTLPCTTWPLSYAENCSRAATSPRSTPTLSSCKFSMLLASPPAPEKP